jgi:hypothetical protein
MSIVVDQSDPQYLKGNEDLSLKDKVNVNIVGKDSSSRNIITLNNVNKSTSTSDNGNWNLEVAVFNVGLQCPPDSEFFKVPPCTGPYPNYNLTIITSDGKSILVKTDINGKFKTLLKPGSYVITAPNMKDTSFTIEENTPKKLNLLISDKGLE